MGRFEVDGAEVLRAGACVQACATRIGQEVDTMSAALVQLQGCWQGAAATTFQEVAAQWRGTQERVRSDLEGIRLALAGAARGYEEAEAAALRMFGR